MRDLWPQDIESKRLRAPVIVLREQGTFLAERTKNLIKAEVRQVEFAPGDTFEYAFFIVAPALGNYRFRLLKISYGVELYPVKIEADDAIMREMHQEIARDSQGRFIAPSEEEFLLVLEKVFNTQRTKQIIAAILAQVEFEPERT